MGIGIIATGVGLGELIHSNISLKKQVKNYNRNRSGLPLEKWIEKNFGISTRRVTKRLPSDLAVEACKEAIQKAELNITDIDFLILNTASGDRKQPTTATAVQSKLLMKENSFAIEINMPCSGNIYGIAIAKSFIESGLGKLGLVVGVDKMTDLVDKEDFIMSGMFGDGAGACVVGECASNSIVKTILKSTFDFSEALCIQAGGSVEPITNESLIKKNNLLKMKGAETTEFIKKTINEVIQELMTYSELNKKNITQIIPHQASKKIILNTLTDMGFTEEQVYFSLEKYGNTSSGSILITLNDYLKTNQKPKNIFLIGMGGGLNWGGMFIKWH
jgi:3-oxoacyl-[acyl-carrier-protein] synthase III